MKLINDKIGNKLNLNSIKFDYINSLIINDEDFRRFFCDASLFEMFDIKSKIINFTEIDYLEKLELLHPDVLKIRKHIKIFND